MTDKPQPKPDWHVDQNGYRQCNKSTDSRLDDIDDQQKEHEKKIEKLNKP